MVNQQTATPGVERILVTGATGFIGLHTVRALLDVGHGCVLASHRTTSQPEFLEDEIGDRVVVEQLDVADHAAVLALGERHRIGGIVHLADPALTHLAAADLAPTTLIEDQRTGISALLNALEASSVWRARRVTLTSTIGVYGGLEDMRGLREDTPLPLSAGGNPVGEWKKTVELLAASLAHRLDVQLAIARLPAVWGPLGRNSSRSERGGGRRRRVRLPPIFRWLARRHRGRWCSSDPAGRLISGRTVARTVAGINRR